MTRKEALIDELLKECNSPEDILGEDGLLKQLTKSLVERALEGEMTDHLGYPKHSCPSQKPYPEKKLANLFRYFL